MRFVILLSILHTVDASKVPASPPAEFVLDVSSRYLGVSDVVLSSHEDSGVPLDAYARLLHCHAIFTSVFEWKWNVSSEEQFQSFIHVVSGGGRHRKAVFFLDQGSTRMFLPNAAMVGGRQSMACFYKWVFFDFEGVDLSPLHSFRSSAVCWGTIFVTRKDRRESEDVRFSLSGPAITGEGNCVLRDPLGFWTSSRGLSKTKTFQKRIKDLQNKTFPASFLNEQPFFAETEEGSEGLEYELLETLKKRLHFSVRYVNNTDGDFGYRLRNGTWTGFVGLIASGKAIFSIATLTISNKRLEAVDFTSPYVFSKLSFAVLSPALESRKFVLVKPLHPEVWLALLTTLILCTCVLYLITHSLPCKSGVRRAYNIWFLLRTLGQQGTPSPAPARYSIRFFISGWWFFIMVILWSYAGKLTSFMIYPGSRQAVDTLKKLQGALEAGHLRYGTLKGTSYENFLMTDMSDVNPVFGQSLLDHPDGLVRTIPEGMRKVVGGGYAFVCMKAILKWFAASLGYDRFRFSKDVFSLELVGVAFQKCHPAMESFDHIVDRLEETGFFMKWYDDAFTKARMRAPQVDIRSFRPLSLDDVQGAFYFLAICLTAAAVVLLLEIAAPRCFGTRRKPFF